MEGFTYGGTLVSNGDIFPEGKEGWSQARNYIGNNHGGMLELDGEYYIFYHRQTNRSSYARQACAERLTRDQDGGFRQAEMTSCGLNGGPLMGNGRYEARIACNLRARQGTGRYDGYNPRRRLKAHPYFTQDRRDGDPDARQYIANMRDGSSAGFKYFRFEGLRRIGVTVRGRADGCLGVYADPEGGHKIAEIPVKSRRDWTEFSAEAGAEDGIGALYFIFKGKGSMDFLEFVLV